MKYQQWNLRQPGTAADLRRLEASGLPPLCAAVLCARGLTSPERASRFLAYDSELFHDPFLMCDMDKAVARIRRGLERSETIAVYGDYDVDGITATCLLSEALSMYGGRVVCHIPDRAGEGYGLNISAILRLHQQGVTLIVTVDCGITAADEVEYARSLGIDVVITDHHQCKGRLPAAIAVVDPHRPDCTYPFPDLAGVGVALKVAQALAPEHQREAVFRRCGELAAIGTVADVMPLIDENRALVRQGLELLDHTQRPGLRALLRIAKCDGSPSDAGTISFGLAPRMNASGRLAQATIALELLTTRDPRRGETLAQELNRLNQERHSIEQNIIDQCVAILGESSPPCVVLASEGWHQGVVGIVASRLSEKYACPAFMICLENGRGKGSCRSFGGFNLFAALEQCAPLLEGYGGHEMAAGFTILEENIPKLKERLCALVSAYTGGQAMTASVDVDVEIESCAMLSLEQADALAMLEPVGTGNPEPLFLLRSAAVVSCNDVKNGRHLKMRVSRDGVAMDAIFFSCNLAASGVSPGDRLDLLFHLSTNTYRGERSVQLRLRDLRRAPTQAQLEQELFQRLRAGDALSRWEAGMMLPSRRDFTRLWRLLERVCAQGPVLAGPELFRQAMGDAVDRGAYGRALVCLHVMDDRGLIQASWTGLTATVRLNRPEHKVDLEEALLMRQLRAFLE